MDKIVLKLGTGVLTDQDGTLAATRLARILDEVIPYLRSEDQLVLVSSGAVGLGRVRLGLNGTLSLHEKQMCAAVGQAVLMQYYNMILSKYDFTAGQVLLTSGDLANGKRRQNLLATLLEMEKHPIIPVINENDTISTEELELLNDHSFGDNDRLSALIAAEIKAKLLIMLTDIAGIFQDRKSYEKGECLQHVQDLSLLDRIETWTGSVHGRGGAMSKISAARTAVEAGTPCWITSGIVEEQLAQGVQSLVRGQVPRSGTLISGGLGLWKK